MKVEFTIDYAITGADSMNKIYSGQFWARRREYAAMIHFLTEAAMKQAKVKDVMPGPVAVTVEYPECGIDIDNLSYFAKCVIDGMKKRIVTDDSPRYVRSLTQRFYGGKLIKVIVEERDA